MKKWFKNFGSAFLEMSPKLGALILCSLLFCVTLVVVELHCREHIEIIYKNTYNITNSSDLTAREVCMLEELLQNDRIQPVADVYNQTATYYTSLITVLAILVAFITAILAICAFVSWFSFKSKIKDEIKDCQTEMIESNLFQAWLKDQLKMVFDQNIENSFIHTLGDSAIKDKLFEELYYRVKNEIENESKKIVVIQREIDKED